MDDEQCEKDELLRLSVLGEYELKAEDGNTYKRVFLDNGGWQSYVNGRKGGEETKWSIVHGEIHTKFSDGSIGVI